MKLTEEELRKEIRKQLNELHGGGWGDDAGTHSTSGVDGLKKIFVEPFTDVLKTTAAGVETVSSQAQKVLASVSALLINTLIPFVEKDWDKIRHADNQRMAAIQSKYKDVFDRNHAAIFEGDGKAMTFLWNPAEFLTARAFLKSPTAFTSILRLLAGQNPKILKKIDKLDGAVNKLVRKKNESVDKNELMLVENGLFAAAIKYIENSGLIDEIVKMPIVQEMRQDAETLLRDHVDAIYDSFRSIAAYTGLSKLDQLTGGQIGKYIKKLADEVVKKTEHEIAEVANKLLKKTYIDKLKNELENLPKEFHGEYKVLFQSINKL